MFVLFHYLKAVTAVALFVYASLFCAVRYSCINNMQHQGRSKPLLSQAPKTQGSARMLQLINSKGMCLLLQ